MQYEKRMHKQIVTARLYNVKGKKFVRVTRASQWYQHSKDCKSSEWERRDWDSCNFREQKKSNYFYYQEERERKRAGANFTNILMHVFFVRKFCAYLLWTYILGLYFLWTRILAQKSRVNCWWKCPLVCLCEFVCLCVFVCGCALACVCGCVFLSFLTNNILKMKACTNVGTVKKTEHSTN